jgi:hypothetical protein
MASTCGREVWQRRSPPIPDRIMTPSLCRSLIAAATLAMVAAACGGPGAPAAAPVPAREVGAFVVRLGADTVAVEEFWRTTDRFEGRQVVRTPRFQLRTYAAELEPDGTIRTFRLEAYDAPGAEPTVRTHMEFDGDSATLRINRGGAEQGARVAAPEGSLPFVGYSVALYELAFVKLRARGAGRMAASQVPLTGQPGFALEIDVREPGTAVVRTLAGENRARIDDTGRLLSWDGRGSTLDIAADRLPVVDLDGLAREFAAREAAGAPLGTLSPRDTLTADIAGATIAIEYSRPTTRGRQIFGNVVPLDQVWRTGANAATVLRTNRDLMIGGTHVPAGAYSVFTVPGAQGWQLILNRQTGQWGTEHDPAQDLARIPMRRESLPEPVERFTIALEPAEGGRAILRMAWDDTRASVPVQVH